MPTQRNRTAPLSIVALQAITAVLYVLATGHVFAADAQRDWTSLVGLVLLGVPQVVVPVLLFLRPGPRAYGAMLILAVSNVVVALVVGILSLLGGPGLLLPLAVFICVQLILLLWASVRTVRSGTAGIPAVLFGGAATLLWPALIWAGATFLGAGVDLLQLRAVLSRQADARVAIVRAQRCLLAHRERTGGFPETLDVLSVASPCLKAEDLRASRGRPLEYVPGPRDADGRIATFELRAVVDGEGDYRSVTMIGDERGFVARSDEVGTPPIDDRAFRTDGIPQLLEQFRRCAVSQSVDGAAPPSLTPPAVVGDLSDPCLGVASDDSGFIVHRERRSGYRMEYRPEAGIIRVQARPVQWGETALRSYLMEAGRIHVTADDREARVSDPVLQPCLPEYAGDCLPTPAEVPPVAVFQHDSVASPDSLLLLRGGVVGAPDRKPFLRIVFECNAHPDSLPAAFPAERITGRYEAVNPATCSGGAMSRPPLGDRVILRMWMNKGNGYWAISDTIPYLSPRAEPAGR